MVGPAAMGLADAEKIEIVKETDQRWWHHSPKKGLEKAPGAALDT
jgi:hypothetical protein